MFNPLTWILATMAVAVVAWNLTWYAQASSWPPLARWSDWAAPPEPWATLLRGLYLAGVPLAALAARVVPPETMGLVAPSGRTATVLAIGLAVAVAALVVLSRDHYERSLGTTLRWGWQRPTPARLGGAALTALFLELHWAFFRGATLSLGMESRQQAVFLALGLLAVEAWLDPWRRHELDDPSTAQALSEGATLAVLSAATFLVTGSSILALALHLATRGTWLLLVPTARRRSPTDLPADGAIEPTIV